MQLCRLVAAIQPLGLAQPDVRKSELQSVRAHILSIMVVGKAVMAFLNKGWPENLISLCWEGLKKINDTSFVFEKKNFVPDRDLEILLIDNHDLLPVFSR